MACNLSLPLSDCDDHPQVGTNLVFVGSVSHVSRFKILHFLAGSGEDFSLY